jgi:hypothetical protein
MNDLELTITAKDVDGAEDIAQLVRECEQASTEGLHLLYARIAGILSANVERLNLDEDIGHLAHFARCMACEAMSLDAQKKHFGGGCWSSDPLSPHPPFFRKRDGRNAPESEIRPPDRRQAVMLRTVAFILRYDSHYAKGAQALVQFQDSQGHWSEADIVDRD